MALYHALRIGYRKGILLHRKISQENLTPDDGDPVGSAIETVFLDNNSVILQKELFQWNISTRIDKIEYSSTNLFSYEKSDINKFYSNYFGVINLSDYSIRFKEYRILGRGLNSAQHPHYMIMVW